MSSTSLIPEIGSNRVFGSGIPPGLTKMILVKFKYAVLTSVSMKLSPVTDAPMTTILVLIVICSIHEKNRLNKKKKRERDKPCSRIEVSW